MYVCTYVYLKYVQTYKIETTVYQGTWKKLVTFDIDMNNCFHYIGSTTVLQICSVVLWLSLWSYPYWYSLGTSSNPKSRVPCGKCEYTQNSKLLRFFFILTSIFYIRGKKLNTASFFGLPFPLSSHWCPVFWCTLCTLIWNILPSHIWIAFSVAF